MAPSQPHEHRRVTTHTQALLERVYYYTGGERDPMGRIIQSFSLPEGSPAHARLKAWKSEGANISARLQMLLEGDSTDPHASDWPTEWNRPSAAVMKRMEKIQCVLFDVDGVFTDGTILRDGDGVEQRRFSVIDGHGTALLREAGLLVGVVSREPSEITRSRMEKLQMAELHVGATDKSSVLREIKARHGFSSDQIAFMGDDLPDLAAFEEVGLCLSPANAQPQVKRAADWVSRSRGGEGAVREACEVLLACR
jgi:3-deoxy-D-manno-octulosonate 8-phosphate phosphatase (KDO 8-P phosphatase)